MVTVTNKRRALLLAGSLTALGVRAQQQQPKSMRRIGFLGSRSRSTPGNPDPYYDAFARGLRDLGYMEGRNIAIEWRFADGKSERLPDLARELVALQVEVIATHATPATLAARQATNAIPIISAAMADPVGHKLAAGLARPGGNVTGFNPMLIDVAPKQVELLRAVAPKARRLACIVNFENPTGALNLKAVEVAAEKLGMSVMPIDVRSSQDLERGFAVITSQGIDALVVLNEPILFFLRQQISHHANINKLPAMYAEREFAVTGGLISYGQNVAELYYRTAALVDKVLKGAKPGDLPIEQARNLSLVINLKTAKALRITIPGELLVRADEVIR